MKLSRIECDPKCGFMVQSHDEKETVSVAKAHAKKANNMDASEADLRKMMKRE